MANLNIYKASAGSGKTYTLALEYIKELLLSNSDYHHRHILAVTFTNDATGEMKSRILAELYGLAFRTKDSAGFLQSLEKVLHEAGKPMNEEQIRQKSLYLLNVILHDYSRLSITTIDSFFQKILKNLAHELGKGSKFNIEMNSSKIRLEAVNSMIEKAHLDKKLINWLTTYVKTKLENDGNWRFKNDVFKFSSCIYDEFFQEHESMLRKQLDEQPDIFSTLNQEQYKRIKEYKIYFQNTYRKVLSILEENQLQPNDFMRGSIIKFWQKLAENPNSGISIKVNLYLDDPENWVAKSNKRRSEIIALVDNQLMDIFEETLDAFNRYNTAKLIAGNIHQLGLIWYIVNEIDDINRENNRFMLSDTASLLYKMIDDSDAPFIYEKIGSEIRHVMIDEFQDTSRLQWGNFKALLSNILANNDFSMVVGDEKQSIYRWRNGDWRILNNIDKELNVKIKTLDYNFRSEKEIVDFNNQVFAEAGKLLEEKSVEELENTSDSPFQRIYHPENVSQKSVKTENPGFVSVDFLTATEELSYKEAVLEHLLENLGQLQASGITASDVCILTRTNNEIQTIADYLSEQKKHFPELNKENFLDIISDEAFQLNSSLSVKIIMEALKMIANPDDAISRVQLDYFLKIADPAGKQNSRIESGKLAGMPLFELIIHLYNLFELEKIEGQSAYLFFFFDAVQQFLENNPPDITAFISFWDEELKTKTIPSGEGIAGIRTMTIHKSKGLQFNTVLIPFCNWELNPRANTVIWAKKKEGTYNLELLPVNYSSIMNDTVFSEEYREETSFSWLDNLNLLYVAFTRPIHNLIIFSKYKKTLKDTADVKTVSDILQWVIPNLNGKWNLDILHYETGSLNSKKAKPSDKTDNPLKQTPPVLNVVFRAEIFNPEKSIFKQSNKSREFITGKTSAKEKYVSYGAIMHELLARIHTLEDIEQVANEMVNEGLILPEEKTTYTEKIKAAIRDAKVDDWFNGRYKTYSELPIIMEDKVGITTRRPDRVLFLEDSTLIVDFKFGEQLPSHKKQVQEYVNLLEGMNYPNVKACLWYVEKGILEY